jgi:hypothetical protein
MVFDVDGDIGEEFISLSVPFDPKKGPFLAIMDYWKRTSHGGIVRGGNQSTPRELL